MGIKARKSQSYCNPVRKATMVIYPPAIFRNEIPQEKIMYVRHTYL